MDKAVYRTRALQDDDMTACMRLKEIAGWNQIREDWKFLIGIGSVKLGALVGDKIVGTITDIRYEDHFHWIGMVLVDPAFRRKGIATRLMEKVMGLFDGDCPFRLDATEEGKELYDKLGFIVEQYLHRYYCEKPERVHKLKPGTACRRFSTNDLERVALFDSEVFGANRYKILEYLLLAKPSYGWLSESGGDIHGYCMGRPGSNCDQIGPVVAKEQEIAESLLVHALDNAGANSLIIDSYNAKNDWNSFLTRLGFQRQRPLIRMYSGNWEESGIPDFQYAIAGPEWG
jgi:ribosomal protein S18 acetylase RimI-like enzyme